MVVIHYSGVEYCRVTYAGQSLINYLYKLGVRPRQQLLVHGAFKQLKHHFPSLTPHKVNEILTEMITPKGSVIFPTFTYCLKKTDDTYKTFDPATSPAATGVLAQKFWNRTDVMRTLSPTHSFGLWGQAAHEEQLLESPRSPLGHGSVLEWLAQQRDAHILFLGTDFRAFSFGHYLECITEIPWVDVFPWGHVNALPVGVSSSGEQPLIQVPGCSGGFMRFQAYLEDQDLIYHASLEGYESMFISIPTVLDQGKVFFNNHGDQLLCPAGACKPCDVRRQTCGIV